MSKSEKSVILPGEGDGWEIWSLRDGVVKHIKSLEGAVTKADSHPNACVAFSVCRVATLPLVVPSSDKEIYTGAAQMELENAGLLIDVENYQGWDCVMVESSSDQAFVSAIYLLEEELNKENDLRQYTFDYSARFYSPNNAGDCIALWKERNTWCLAFYRNNIPFLIEPLGAEVIALDTSVSLLLSQLAIKGIDFQPHELLLWSQSDKAGVFVQELTAVNILLKQEPRPVPSFPTSKIDLQPSAVSDWHKRVNSMMRLRFILTAVAALYIIMGVVLWWKNYQLDNKITNLQEEVTAYTPSWESNQDHFATWDELYPVVTENWPLKMYKECVMSIPGGQPIRFTNIDVQNGFIQIKGSGVSVNAVNAFKAKLKKSETFSEYEWEMMPAKRSPKTAQWDFQYNAKPIGYSEY